jgi:hypothetical protein
MSRFDELPPDQSAALSLLLRQRKSYADVAKLLGIGDRAVHDRAHAALVMLAPRGARELSPERRLEIGDYLLGQQPGVAERLRTRTYLAGSQAARAWAGELATPLSPLAGAGLPEIPAPVGGTGAAGGATGAGAQEPQRVSELSSATPAPTPGSSGPGPGGAGNDGPGSSAGARGSRTAGAVLLAVLAAAVIVAVVLITNGGGSHAKTTSTSATTTTAAKGKGPKVEAQIKLTPSDPASKLIAVVYVLAEGSKRAFFIAAQNLPETHNFYYAIWLYNSPTSFLPLSRSPGVGANHSLAGGSALPANAGEFHEILLTEETRAKPTHPGHVIAHGPFKV